MSTCEYEKKKKRLCQQMTISWPPFILSRNTVEPGLSLTIMHTLLGVAFALVLSLKSPNAQIFLTATLAMVFWTVFVQVSEQWQHWNPRTHRFSWRPPWPRSSGQSLFRLESNDDIYFHRRQLYSLITLTFTHFNCFHSNTLIHRRQCHSLTITFYT